MQCIVEPLVGDVMMAMNRLVGGKMYHHCMHQRRKQARKQGRNHQLMNGRMRWNDGVRSECIIATLQLIVALR